MSAFRAVQDRVIAALLQAPAVAGGRIAVNRDRPRAKEEGSAVVVRLVASGGAEQAIGQLQWETVFEIECYGRSTADQRADETVDVLLAEVWSRLAAIADSGDGVVAVHSRPEINWEHDGAESGVSCATVRLTVAHRTPVASLEAWS